MISLVLSDHQLALIKRPIDGRVFLVGPAGAGKTTAGVGRLLHFLEAGIPAESILVVAPQRTLTRPYYEALRSPELVAGGQVTVLTVGGLARRMVDLFWPLIAEKAGFAQPHRRPTFLTLETAQYLMARVLRPLLAEGYFDALTIECNRLHNEVARKLQFLLSPLRNCLGVRYHL